MTESIKKVIERYRQGAIMHSDFSNTKKANKGADQVHACYNILRETEEGRQVIIAMMDDSDPGVRGWAAVHSLQWVPQRARAVLEALSQSKDIPWQTSFDAEMTLKEYDKGNLKFDW